MEDFDSAFLIGYLVVALVAVILVLVVWYQIFKKAGCEGWMAILMIVPLVNVIMMLVLAFGEWPIHQELRRLRAQVRGEPAGPTG